MKRPFAHAPLTLAASLMLALSPVMAQAGDIELAHSAEIVTKAMAGMGLGIQDTARIADVLALGANATNSSVEGLAQALKSQFQKDSE